MGSGTADADPPAGGEDSGADPNREHSGAGPSAGRSGAGPSAVRSGADPGAERSSPGRTPDEGAPVLSPSAEYPPLGVEEVAVLRGIGERWSAALRRQPTRELPLDPTLLSYARPPGPGRFGRLAPIESFRPHAPDEPDELVATGTATLPRSRVGRVGVRLRRLVVGPPLASTAVVYERMRKLVALPVLASDLLSSVAYGPEAMLTVLVLAGSGALGLSLPLSAVLVVLMITVGASYRQTIQAYPHGAGSYIVACDNLGAGPGLAAAAGLLMDYVLTVSVSLSASVHAVTSALPALAPWTVPLGLVGIALLLAGNLRGVRTAGNLFALPTYLFVVALLAVLLVGYLKAAGRGFTPLPPPPVPAVAAVDLLLVLRAFSSGAVSMTGIEAVSNAVPAFRSPEWRNARTTLTWMVVMLAGLFAGLVVLIHLDGLAPRPEVTLLSQLARHTFPTGPWYALIQAVTAVILLLAANTAFNDFPRLLFFVARDGHAPRRFLHMGDRLAFSNGLVALAVAAALIFVLFGGHTEKLVPLYAVGVFLAFTLSQTGMVVHWWRHRGPRWRGKLAVNATGAAMSAVVLATAAVAKFTEGAWVVVIAIPLLILLGRRIRRHYDRLHRALALHPPAGAGGREAAGCSEEEELPQQVRHLVVVPVVRLNRASLRALAYAISLGQPVFAVHIAPEEREADRFQEQWQAWGDHLRLETIVSPYRAVIAPLAHYLEALHLARSDLVLTVVVPEVILGRRRHRLLHTRTEQRLRRALRALPGVVVTTVPVHLTD